jgi:isocitrate dehydrogenase
VADGFNETYCTDHWRCRFKPSQDTKIYIKRLICYLVINCKAKNRCHKTENLYEFDGKSGYSLVKANKKDERE